MSWKSVAAREYRAGKVWVGPSRVVPPAATRSWSAIAIRAAQQGAPRLVPPIFSQGPWPEVLL